MSFISQLRIILIRLSRGLALAGLYVLLLSALLVGVAVVTRKMFGIALVGADELSGYALALATSWSLSFAFYEGSHIRVNVIHMNLPVPAKAWLDVLAVLVMALLMSMLGWSVSEMAFESLEFNRVSNTPLRIPLWIPQVLFIGGICLFAVSTMVVFLESLGHVLKRNYTKVIDQVEPKVPQEDTKS